MSLKGYQRSLTTLFFLIQDIYVVEKGENDWIKHGSTN